MAFWAGCTSLPSQLKKTMTTELDLYELEIEELDPEGSETMTLKGGPFWSAWMEARVCLGWLGGALGGPTVCLFFLGLEGLTVSESSAGFLLLQGTGAGPGSSAQDYMTIFKNFAQLFLNAQKYFRWMIWTHFRGPRCYFFDKQTLPPNPSKNFWIGEFYIKAMQVFSSKTILCV